MTRWPKPLRWVIVLVIVVPFSIVLAMFGDQLPLGDDIVGSMLRGLLVGAVTVAAIRLLRLGKWDTPGGS